MHKTRPLSMAIYAILSFRTKLRERHDDRPVLQIRKGLVRLPLGAHNTRFEKDL
jgi:hypothetical protein